MARIPKTAPALVGRWRIMHMSGWDRDAIDLVQPGYITFADDGSGEFGFVAVRGWLSCHPADWDGRTGVKFTWEGIDEGNQLSGHGRALLVDDHAIEGHLFIHFGDDSSFRAAPFTTADRAGES